MEYIAPASNPALVKNPAYLKTEKDVDIDVKWVGKSSKKVTKSPFKTWY